MANLFPANGTARKFFWLNAVAALALLLLAANALYGRTATKVVAFFPQNAADAAAGRVEVEFSAPLDPQSVNQNSLFLSPSADGTATLADPRRLIFTPNKPFAAATNYRIGLSANLRDLHGRPIAGSGEEMIFATTALKVEKVEPVSFDLREGFVIAVHFNNVVAPEEIRKHLRIYAGDSTAIPEEKKQSLEYQILSKAGCDLRLRLPSRQHACVTVALPAGTTGVDGPRGLENDYAAAVDLLALKPGGENGENAVRFLGMAPRENWRGAYISVRTNTPLEAARAPEFVAITPEVAHNFVFSDEGLLIQGDFRPGTRYQVTLKKGFPAGAIGALSREITRSVWFNDQAARLKFAYGSGFFTPGGLLKIPLTTVNVREVEIDIAKLYANNLLEYALNHDHWKARALAHPLTSRKLAIKAAANVKTETLLDLRELTAAGKNAAPAAAGMPGIYYLRVKEANSWRNDAAVAVVTDLGLTLRMGQNDALCWVTSLTGAVPQPGTAVKIYSDKRQELASALTDAQGLARLTLPPLAEDEHPAVLIAEKDGDLSYLLFAENGQPRKREVTAGAQVTAAQTVFATAERGAYRPGETVKLSALVRDSATLRATAKLWLECVITRPDGRECQRTKVQADDAGRLLAEIAIPVNAPSGHYRAAWKLPANEDIFGVCHFAVADFIPPTLQMALSAPAGILPTDKPLSLTAEVKHLFGAPAANLPVKCRAFFNSVPFVPADKQWEKFTFNDGAGNSAHTRQEEYNGVLGADGKFVFAVAAPALASEGLVRAALHVEVLENGGRALNEQLERDLYPQLNFLGTRLPDSIKYGEFTKIPVVALKAARPAELLLAGELNCKAVLSRVTYANVLRRNGTGGLVYDWTRSETVESELTGKLINGRGEIVINPKAAGEYRLTVSAPNCRSSVVGFYAAGAGETLAVHAPDEVAITLDKKKYRPGDTVNGVLQAPFAGNALICVENRGIVSAAVKKVVPGNNQFTLKVSEDWRPNVYVTATLLRPVAAEDNWQPHRAAGETALIVDCNEKKLTVAVGVPDELRPAAPLTAKVKVTDTAGRPVANAAVILTAVDSGVLSLTRFTPPSPFAFFYAKRALLVRTYDMFSNLAPELARWAAKAAAAPGGDGGAGLDNLGKLLNPILAKRVQTAVLYAGTLTTDADGSAAADFTLPEYSGELRFMVYAAHDDRFGLGEKAVPVRSPLMFRASWPRFAADGDTFAVPVTVFNRTAGVLEAAPALTLSPNLQLTAPLPEKIRIPANGETTLRLLCKAAATGKATARLQISAAGSGRPEQYQESVEFAIRSAAGRGEFRGGQTVAPGETVKLTMPGKFYPETAATRLCIAGNPLAPAAAAIRGLLDYPYGCLEQTVSRLRPLIDAPDLAAAVRDTEAAAPEFGREEIAGLLAAGFTRLELMQQGNGGLAMWPGAGEVYPWGTIYAADLLNNAKKAGYSVPEALHHSVLEYCRNHLELWTTRKDAAGRHLTLPQAAYATAVLTAAGTPPYRWLGRLEEIVREIRTDNKEALPVSVAANLARTYFLLGKPELAAELWAVMPEVADGRTTGGCLASLNGDMALLLTALLDLKPQDPQIPQLAATLAANLGRGATTTFENAAIFSALAKYARSMACDPAGKVTVTFAGGKKAEYPLSRFTVLNSIAPGAEFTISVNGKTPAHLAWTSTGAALPGTELKEGDNGAALRREIRDMQGRAVAPNALQSGELYYVTLKVASGTAMPNVVISDLLPAGLEIENQNLRTSAQVPLPDGAAPGRLLYPRHTEIRDDRLLLFADLPAAAAEYSYLVRAVTPGTFALPAAELENMYDPAIRSRYGAGKITVKP